MTSVYGGLTQENQILYVGSAMFSSRKNGMSSLGLDKSQLNRRLLLLIQVTVKTTVPPFVSWDVAWLDTFVSF